MDKCDQQNIVFVVIDKNSNQRLESREYRDLVVWTLKAEALKRASGSPDNRIATQMATHELIRSSHQNSKAAWGSHFTNGIEELSTTDLSEILRARDALEGQLAAISGGSNPIRKGLLELSLSLDLQPLYVRHKLAATKCKWLSR